MNDFVAQMNDFSLVFDWADGGAEVIIWNWKPTDIYMTEENQRPWQRFSSKCRYAD
jgi:hypothetical protein